MSVSVLLDQYAVPERGTFTISVNRSVEIAVTADEARRKTKDWLINEISYMMTATLPTLVVGKRIVWRVPAVLTASHMGPVGVVGEVDVDVETGEIDITEEHKKAILKNVKKLAKRMPPYTRREDMPEELLVRELKPTREPGRPEGNPLDFLPTR